MPFVTADASGAAVVIDRDSQSASAAANPTY
jgi:hypothetical protein